MEEQGPCSTQHFQHSRSLCGIVPHLGWDRCWQPQQSPLQLTLFPPHDSPRCLPPFPSVGCAVWLEPIFGSPWDKAQPLREPERSESRLLQPAVQACRL